MEQAVNTLVQRMVTGHPVGWGWFRVPKLGDKSVLPVDDHTYDAP
jgi:hypothetical protein